MKKPGETRRSQQGPGFENALRACLVTGVVLIDWEKKIASLTPEASEILGFSKDQGPELSLDSLPESILKIANQSLASGKPSAGQQITTASKDRLGFIHVSAVPIKSPSGHSAAVLTLHTVNASSQFLTQIHQLDRLANAGTLAAGMAHEIKNALVAGRTFLDLLLEKNGDEELVEIVRKENSRIDALVSRMLRFAATNASALTALHLHEVLDQALRLIQPQLDNKSIGLERSFRANPDTIQGDNYELQQAFVNLSLNALEAMAPGGRLTASTEIRSVEGGPPRLEVRIQDTGCGISPDHMDHLFEPFFTTKSAGTGLGLPVTQRIIQEHGGSISVQSRPGQGTTFLVVLPLAVPVSETKIEGAKTVIGSNPG
jgi:nitrogen-specific signal transduction histidine kinase